MMYVFGVLIAATLVLSVFSVAELTQAAGSLLGAADDTLLAGRVLLMLLIVVALVLLVGFRLRKRNRTRKS